MRQYQVNTDIQRLNYERINGTKDKNIRSQIDQIGEQSLGLLRGNHITLARHMMMHICDRNRRVEINGNRCITDIRSSRSEQRTLSMKERLSRVFTHLRDRELMRRGIPKGLIPLIRTIQNDNDLEAMEEKLPSLAFRLFLIAAGYSYEEAGASRDEIDSFKTMQRTHQS